MLSAIPLGYRVAAVLAFVAGTYLAGLLTGREQVQSDWDAARVVQLQAAHAAEINNRAREQSMLNKLTEAQNAATLRETKLRADYAAAHAAALGLRDTIAAARNRLPTDTPAACHQTAATALDVFSECSAEVERLAEAADGCFSDRKTLEDSWPE